MVISYTMVEIPIFWVGEKNIHPLQLPHSASLLVASLPGIRWRAGQNKTPGDHSVWSFVY